jgi:thiol-disulfide isomerase/thioredoxin
MAMGTASRNQPGNARAKAAAQRAAAQRRRRTRKLLLAGGSAAAVVAVVAGLVVAKSMRQPARQGPAATLAVVAGQLAAVPASTLTSVGTGTASGLQPAAGQPPLLTEDGKPEVLYIGAEWCPYCAAERWALTVALDRFGTFSGLRFIHSSTTDEPSDIPTLSYDGSSYTSRYLAFSPVEMYTNVAPYHVLQVPTSAQNALFTRYDGPPYVSAQDKLSYPFVDIANRYILIGAQYVPTDLSGLTWSQIAAAVKHPGSAVAKDVDGAANVLTAALCRATGGKPATVCSSVPLASATAAG